jgi:hypothetical protein
VVQDGGSMTNKDECREGEKNKKARVSESSDTVGEWGRERSRGQDARYGVKRLKYGIKMKCETIRGIAHRLAGVQQSFRSEARAAPAMQGRAICFFAPPALLVQLFHRHGPSV